MDKFTQWFKEPKTNRSKQVADGLKTQKEQPKQLGSEKFSQYSNNNANKSRDKGVSLQITA